MSSCFFQALEPGPDRGGRGLSAAPNFVENGLLLAPGPPQKHPQDGGFLSLLFSSLVACLRKLSSFRLDRVLGEAHPRARTPGCRRLPAPPTRYRYPAILLLVFGSAIFWAMSGGHAAAASAEAGQGMDDGSPPASVQQPAVSGASPPLQHLSLWQICCSTSTST